MNCNYKGLYFHYRNKFGGIVDIKQDKNAINTIAY